jgi:subtilisin family serine protease
MTSRFFAMAVVAALAAVSAVSAVGPQQPQLRRPTFPGTAALHVFGGRSLQQSQSATGSKYDAALAGIARHLNGVRPDHALLDLQSLNPAVKFMAPSGGAPLVLIDAVTLGDPQQLKAALIELGLQHAALYSNDVSGWLPVAQLDAATARNEVHSIRAAMPKTRTGAVTSQGDFAQHSDVMRSANALTGAGVTVGVLSDSYDCFAQFASANLPKEGSQGWASNGFDATAANDMASGDLPSNVNVLEDSICVQQGNYYGYPEETPPSDEGRAMLQIVHDVAPGANLAFRTGNLGEADFASGITQLAAPVASGGAGANIIADDLGYFDEPFFQDGIVAQAVDTVEAQGVAYFSAAGNDGSLAYDNNGPSFTTLSVNAPNQGEYLLNFDTTGVTNTIELPITMIDSLDAGEFIAIVVEWDQPYVTGSPTSGGATSQIDVCVNGSFGGNLVTDDNLNVLADGCTGPNKIGSDPVQVLIIGNPANSSITTSSPGFNIVVGLAGGAKPGRIKVAVEGDGIRMTINQFAPNGNPTIQGHPAAAGAAAVGAAFFLSTPACGVTPTVLETYSSLGGDPILFDATTGARLPAPVYRQKPNIVGPDGGNNTFLGFTFASAGIDDESTITGCKNDAAYPNFFGTSAATPHAASIAALLLQANPALTPTQLYTALQSTALPIGNAPNALAGYGFVQADAAYGAISVPVPPEPSLTLTASSVPVGTATTLNWSSANNQGCTGSGAWSGALASSGSQTITPTAVGATQYLLDCTNATGTSAQASVTLTATAAAAGGGGGGGGALGIGALLGLAGLCAAGAANRRSWNRRVR